MERTAPRGFFLFSFLFFSFLASPSFFLLRLSLLRWTLRLQCPRVRNVPWIIAPQSLLGTFGFSGGAFFPPFRVRCGIDAALLPSISLPALRRFFLLDFIPGFFSPCLCCRARRLSSGSSNLSLLLDAAFFYYFLTFCLVL
jgi:hypothetical protein